MLTGRHLGQDFCGGHRRLVAVALLAVAAAGCKSGTWGSKPSWWSFGGTAPNESLASAPSFDPPVAKPSEAAKPYPTTETPEGYVLSDATRTDGESETDAPAAGLVEASSITYGTTRPAEPTAGPASPAAVDQPVIGPQVGPYASLSQPPATTPAATAAPADPAEAATAGLAAAPGFNHQPVEPGPTSRYAATPPATDEPRGSDRWASASPPTTAPPPAGGTSRYAQHSSRFSGGYPPPPAGDTPPLRATPAPAQAEPLATAAPFAEPPAFAGPAAAVEPSPDTAGQPSIEPAPRSSAAPTRPAGQVLPGSLTPPQRRPDPGYRPGGTSSYRPNRAILADDPAAETDVIPAAFQAPPASPAGGL